MALESGTLVDLSYVAEVTHGTTPGSPSMKLLRCTQRNLNLVKDTLQSAEVRSDRQVSDVRHGFNRVEGTVGYELSVQSYDDMLEGALSGTWTAVNISGSPNLGATTAPNTFTRAAGSFITDGIRIGDFIITSGFSNSGNNGVFGPVTAVTALAVTVPQTLVTEAQGASKTLQLKGKRLDIGTTLRTFTFERRFRGTTQYQVHRGVAVNTMELQIQPGNMVGGTFGLIGMSTPALSGTSLGSPSAAPTNSPMSAFDGSLYEGGSINAVITGINMKLDNKRSLQGVVGSKYSPDVFEGTADITGEITAFFQDATYLNKFINETESSLWVKLNDPNGSDFLNLVFPRIKYTGGTIDPPQEGPVPITLPFRALVDSTAGTSFTLQRSNT